MYANSKTAYSDNRWDLVTAGRIVPDGPRAYVLRVFYDPLYYHDRFSVDDVADGHSWRGRAYRTREEAQAHLNRLQGAHGPRINLLRFYHYKDGKLARWEGKLEDPHAPVYGPCVNGPHFHQA